MKIRKRLFFLLQNSFFSMIIKILKSRINSAFETQLQAVSGFFTWFGGWDLMESDNDNLSYFWKIEWVHGGVRTLRRDPPHIRTGRYVPNWRINGTVTYQYRSGLNTGPYRSVPADPDNTGRDGLTGNSIRNFAHVFCPFMRVWCIGYSLTRLTPSLIPWHVPHFKSLSLKTCQSKK